MLAKARSYFSKCNTSIKSDTEATLNKPAAIRAVEPVAGVCNVNTQLI